jgi:hypothetical protein
MLTRILQSCDKMNNDMHTVTNECGSQIVKSFCTILYFQTKEEKKSPCHRGKRKLVREIRVPKARRLQRGGLFQVPFSFSVFFLILN